MILFVEQLIQRAMDAFSSLWLGTATYTDLLIIATVFAAALLLLAGLRWLARPFYTG